MSKVLDILNAIVKEKQEQLDRLLTSNQVIDGVVAADLVQISQAREALLRDQLQVELRIEEENKSRQTPKNVDVTREGDTFVNKLPIDKLEALKRRYLESGNKVDKKPQPKEAMDLSPMNLDLDIENCRSEK